MSPIMITISLLVFATVMFVWEKIPLAATAMIVCLTLILTGILTADEAFINFANSNIILFVAMFVIGGALFETGMANKVGGIVTRFANTERQLIIAIMVIAGLISGFLSNTGTAAIFIPVVIGIANRSGYARSKLLMPLVYAVALGGNLTLIGTPGNLIAQSALQEIDLGLSFFDYAKVGLPLLIVGIIYFAFIGYKLLPEIKEEKTIEDNEANVKDKFKNVPAWKQILSLAVLILTVIGMIFESEIGIPIHVTGSIGALFLVVTNVISEKKAYEAIDLRTIFLFGGTLSLASALEKTGAGNFIAESIIGMLGDNASPLALLVVIFIITMILTNFMSNTATVALLVPIGLEIANTLESDPRAMLVAIVIASSCGFATPISMPANTMILEPGGYKFTDYVKVGTPLMIVSAIVSIILLSIFYPFYP